MLLHRVGCCAPGSGESDPFAWYTDCLTHLDSDYLYHPDAYCLGHLTSICYPHTQPYTHDDHYRHHHYHPHHHTDAYGYRHPYAL
jgi:hypothetical protein